MKLNNLNYTIENKQNLKVLIVIIVTSFLSLRGFSQSDYYGNLNSNIYTASQIIGNPNVKPPDVAAFEKVNFVPVSNYTGRADISIPIYIISAGNLNVPISISYNSSGVKVNEMASNVGLNWNLNAGGLISKNIKGLDDFQRPIDDGSAIHTMRPSGWLGYTNSDFATNTTLNRYNDAQPDVFLVNAPGISTKYIHEKQYRTNSDKSVSLISTTKPNTIELEPKGTKIEEQIIGKMYSSTGFDNIEITSIDGVVYNFGSKDVSKYHSGFGTPVSSFGNLKKVESYRLDNMYDPSTNQSISFEYEEYSISFYDAIPLYINEYGGGTELELYKTSSSYTTYPTTQRLTKIVFDKGYVEFIYGLNRLDHEEEKALTEIKVVNTNGEIVKHVKFEYGYFQSSIESTTKQSRRLRLDRIYDVDANLNELPGHKFTYNNTYDMPPRTSYAHDFLGYNNGSYNSTIKNNPIPRFYFKNNRLYPFSISSSIELPGNFSLEPNLAYAKTYSLSKITYPTGGFDEFTYQLNDFWIFSTTQQGGGLRILSQTINDGNGHEQVLDYEYGTGMIANFPNYALFRLNKETFVTPSTLAELENYLGIDTFLTPQSQVELTSGSFVGYNMVTVKDRVENGSTIYTYSNSTTFPNLLPTKTLATSYGNARSKSWEKIQPPALIIDQDYLRGKVKKEFVYDKNGDLRLEKEYLYTMNQFKTISLDYLNKTSYIGNVNCYDDYGTQYSSTCGYYKEEVNIPIARDLLTTVITKDYQTDKIVYTQGGNENVPFTLQTEQVYFYDTQYPLILRESKRVSTCDETQGDTQDCTLLSDEFDDRYFKEITYPKRSDNLELQIPPQICSLPYTNDLIDQNRLSTPMIIEYKNKDEELISKEELYYKDFGQVIDLEKIHFIDRANGISESEHITKRDTKGRIIEYTMKNGMYVSRFYGYDDSYLVFEVVNANWSLMLTKLQNSQTLFNQGTTANDVDLMSLANELREALPNSQVTSYTYNPLIGITSITDARSETLYYDYDNFNRLKNIKNADGHILSENEYHYRGE